MAPNIEQATCFIVTLTFVTLMTLTSASVITFSVGDVYSELQTWGTVSLSRYNVSDESDELEYSRFTLKVTEVSIRDSSDAVLVSHEFKFQRQEYKIDKWEGAKLEELRAGGRRLYSGPLGDVPGNVEILIYLFREDGEIKSISEDYGQKVEVDDAYFVIKVDDFAKCEICSKASFVDLRINIAGRPGVTPRVIAPKQNGGAQDVLLLPASAGFFVGNKATVDGRRLQVAEGFPKVAVESNKADITVRFPVFTSSAAYGLFVRQDRRTPQQAKKENGTLGAILQANSAVKMEKQFSSFVTSLISLSCLLLLRQGQ